MTKVTATRMAVGARTALAVAGIALLASCGGEEQSELRQELTALTKDLRGRVDPLPKVRTYEPVPYTSGGEVDPFRPQRINVVQAGVASSGGGRKPNFDPKELEAFPLESIRMVGMLTQKKALRAGQAGTNRTG
jgi:type IV pilus assembly protein PilP